jgi:hypothetical protein
MHSIHKLTHDPNGAPNRNPCTTLHHRLDSANLKITFRHDFTLSIAATSQEGASGPTAAADLSWPTVALILRHLLRSASDRAVDATAGSQSTSATASPAARSG